jgi:rod shape-determining protein MreC
MSAASTKQKKEINTNIYVFAALIVISFSTLIMSSQSFIVSFRDLGLSAFSGIRGGIHELTTFFGSTVAAVKEVLVLREAYAELTDRMTRYEQLERSSAEIRAENYRLRQQLDFAQSIRYRHIAAEISGHDSDNVFSSFVINKGTKHGVAKDMPVITYQNGIQSLVGKVIQAGILESLCMPLYDSVSYVSARLAQSRYEGIAEGQGDPDMPLLLRFISKRARTEINIGDVVVSSGLGEVYPAGITLGRVSKLIAKEYETSLEVELESTTDFSKLEYVFVIDKENLSEGF